MKEGIAFGTAFSYVDDCLIVSVGSREEHVALVDAVFQAFHKHQFIFKLSKTELYKQEIFSVQDVSTFLAVVIALSCSSLLLQ